MHSRLYENKRILDDAWNNSVSILVVCSYDNNRNLIKPLFSNNTPEKPRSVVLEGWDEGRGSEEGDLSRNLVWEERGVGRINNNFTDWNYEEYKMLEWRRRYRINCHVVPSCKHITWDKVYIRSISQQVKIKQCLLSRIMDIVMRKESVIA